MRKTDYSWNMKTEENYLLHAILDKDPVKAAQYFEKWSKAVSIDDVDGSSVRLLPMLYRRLSDEKRSFPELQRLAGIYRYSLFHNHMLFKNCLESVLELERQGIETIVLKGGALTAAYYYDNGARPMDDLDILVNGTDIERTIRILNQKGWKGEEGIHLNKLIKAWHSIALYRDNGSTMDVHWCLSDFWFRTEQSQKHRYAKETAVLAGYPISILQPTYQILHNCVHAVAWNPLSSIRWVPDVMNILECRQDEIDWNLIVREAKNEHINLIMEKMLGFIKTEYQANVPDFVLDALKNSKKEEQEQQFYRYLTKTPGFFNLRLKWLAYLHVNRTELKDKTLFYKLILFCDYLTDLWMLDRNWELPLCAVSKMWNKILQIVK